MGPGEQTNRGLSGEIAGSEFSLVSPEWSGGFCGDIGYISSPGARPRMLQARSRGLSWVLPTDSTGLLESSHTED